MALDNAISLQVNNEYFEKFQNKDLTYLRTIYAPDIRLADWNGEWLGLILYWNENASFLKRSSHLQW